MHDEYFYTNLVSNRRTVLQCNLCPQLLQLGVHVTRLYEIHLLLQFPVRTASTSGLKVMYHKPKLYFKWSSSKCVNTCTALVSPAVVFSVPLSSQWLACERSRLRLFPPPHPSHHAYAWGTGGNKYFKSTHKIFYW